MQKFIHSKGFRKCYLNHWDKWQTHYTWSDNFITHDGFRIKYYINGLKEVEQFPKDWPKEWLDSGYVKIKRKSWLGWYINTKEMLNLYTIYGNKIAGAICINDILADDWEPLKDPKMTIIEAAKKFKKIWRISFPHHVLFFSDCGVIMQSTWITARMTKEELLADDWTGE